MADTAPLDGDIIAWNAAASEWEPAPSVFRRHAVANSDYVVGVNDYLVAMTTLTNAREWTLPSPATTRGTATRPQRFVFKNESGAVHDILLTPAAGLIDGAADYTIATAHGAVSMYTDGANYFIESVRT